MIDEKYDTLTNQGRHTSQKNHTHDYASGFGTLGHERKRTLIEQERLLDKLKNQAKIREHTQIFDVVHAYYRILPCIKAILPKHTPKQKNARWTYATMRKGISDQIVTPDC